MEGLINIRHFGATLRARNGLFSLILPDLSGGRNDRTEEFAPSHIQTILLHPKTNVTTDAAILAERNGVTCIILDEKGEPLIFLAGTHPARSMDIWKKQLLLHGTPQGLEFARQWLCTKVRRKLEWLAKLKSYRQDQPGALQLIDDAAVSLEETLTRLGSHSLRPVPEAAHQLRGIEGNGHKIYLSLINDLLPKQYKFDVRSRRPAQDLYNALLNYGYGILYNWVETALWEAGINPYFGFLHSSERDQKAFLYDFIEPYRPWIDRVVFKLCVSKAAALHHVEPVSTGGVSLSAEGLKVLTTAVFEKFRTKKIEGPAGKEWSLRQAIKKDAISFATMLHLAVRTVKTGMFIFPETMKTPATALME